MLRLAVNGYQASDVLDALHASRRTIAFRYDRMNELNQKIEDLDGVMSGSVENNYLADIKRTAKFQFDLGVNMDWGKDRIRPWFRLLMPDGGWAEWPLGIFLPTSPTRQIRGAGGTREIEAYDQLLVLRDDKVESRYVIPTLSNYVEEIRLLLESSGVTTINISASTASLPTAREWEPGTSKLRIVNDLLGAINYTSLSFDAFGAAVAQPYSSPEGRPTGVTYEANERSLLEPDISHTIDYFEIPNKWVLVMSEPEVSFSSTYTNTNPNSPTSTVSRGRTITHFEAVEASDQTALDELAARMAFEASQVFETIEFSSALMPHHGDGDIVELKHSASGISARYTEHTWSLELSAGSSMKHSLRRVVTV